MSKHRQWFQLIAAGVILGAIVALASGTLMRNEPAEDAGASGGSLAGDFLVARMAAAERDEAVATARLGHAIEQDPGNLDLKIGRASCRERV